MAQEAEVSGARASRILVLDANVMLRAVLGRRVRSLIERYCGDVPLFIPSYCVSEVREYLPALCAKRHWDIGPTLKLLDAMLALVRVVEAGFYADFEEQAKHRIGRRDVDDWPVVALALCLGAAVWTEDTDFFGCGLATWTTQTVELYLSNHPWQIHEPPPPSYGPSSGSSAVSVQILRARAGSRGRNRRFADQSLPFGFRAASFE
jgi:predicted nucleic acid-binding protein